MLFFVIIFIYISNQLSPQMDGTRPKRESSLPRYLTSGGNPSNLKTATAIFKGKGYLGVPCSFCVGAAVLCVKNTPDTRCAFCAAWGRSFKTCQDGSSSKSTKRYFKLVVEVFGSRSDNIDLPRTSRPRLRGKGGKLSRPFHDCLPG